MLTNKQVEKIRIKMAKENLKQNHLARLLHISNGSLSIILGRTKNLPKGELSLLKWLNESEEKGE